MKPFFEISISVFNLWLLSGIFLVLNIGFVLLLPKYNIKKFVSVPKVKAYTVINKLSWYSLLIVSIFIPVKTGSLCFYFGLGLFIFGIFFYSASMFYFAISEYHLPVTSGIYKFSRHPVYVSFFIIIIGMMITSTSLIVFFIAFLHFYSLYFIINEEEKMCEKQYGNLYIEYKQKTRKYL